MNRDEMVSRIKNTVEPWDFVIIGGGATGLGCAIEAASRGYQTLLLERDDFSKGTSSRSTKLIHGGVRYLQQGNVSLVLEALRERGRLRRNAPHLVHNLPFVVPSYDWWEGPFYGIGLKLYDMLAGKHGFGHSRFLSRETTRQYLPTVETEGLRGGVIYYDGQFDDSRLAINMAQTAADQSATLVNYMKVTGLIRENQMTAGVRAKDIETGAEYEIRAKSVINATGVFTDQVLRMDDPGSRQIIVPSQGVHLVLDASFLPGDKAIMVPHTADGRVLFATPWHDKVIVGTTDTMVDEILDEPRPLENEIEFLISHAAQYLTKDPDASDVLSIFAGLRPLVNQGDGDSTAALSRDHTIYISRSGLVTITGGKWTTYRKMAEETIDQAAMVAHLDERPCVSHDLHIHGYHNHAEKFGDLAVYGADAAGIRDLCYQRPELKKQIHTAFPTIAAEAVWAVKHEMARTVEDFLARRTRALLLDARASMEAAEETARLMAGELGQDENWIRREIESYQSLARGYFL
ncbi:glycerol-3-phosphate dehydrogenase [Desulfosalsimonas propionicica]|uniref:Glycerol-3-phosphate dehydrogenase n=1 Tax=Desulfosalsimonas propionicica TaxID=332175 RepID=A0A7W0HKY0_9BACT|nr:glycerol-3-phosphate dehydrogenase/oxidase [Desulfosalsimonas propionicica]MBA2881673.1 glycerol-3-phosphate dehydrogenase [Desulfosalsimonas propionicica]